LSRMRDPRRPEAGVAIDAHASDDELNRWLKYGVDYARSLPPK
jgi:hypothetical protein